MPKRSAIARYEAALDIVERAGLERDYSPVLAGLARCGVGVAPMIICSARTVFLSMAALLFVIFGGAYLAAGALQDAGIAFGRGPVAGLLSAGLPGLVVVSVVGAAVMTANMRGKARKAGLPRWDDI